MNSHECSTAVKGNGNGNGVNGTRGRRLITSWTIEQFKQAVLNAGYHGVELFYRHSPPRCQFPSCITRNEDIEEAFGKDQEVRVWQITARGENPRLVLWCKHHQQTDIRGWGDCAVESVIMRESDMIPLFARAAGFFLVTNPDSTSMNGNAQSAIALPASHVAIA